MNPIIKALRDELANEGLSGAAKYEDDADQRFAYYAGHEAASARLLTIVEKAVEMATELSDNGLRFDLNPTQPMGDWEKVSIFYLSYIKCMDESVKEKAREFLTTLADIKKEIE